MKKQRRIITLLMIAMLLLILTPNVNAVLNSNGSTPTTQILNDWLINIRKIESLGGGLGLTETIKSDLTPSTASNNLDIHMEKNTEYGAMAILSASSYGNPNKIASGGTTTGNQTGIVININSEWVAGGNNSTTNNGYGQSPLINIVPNLKNAVEKYKSMYNFNSTYSPKRVGDAIMETSGWHGADPNGVRWFGTDKQYGCGIIRAYSGSVFSFNATGPANNGAYGTTLHYSRAAVVCGEGI